MLVPLAASAACAILLAIGPDRRSARAWLAVGTMIATMAAAGAFGTMTAHLLCGAVAVATAPAIVARVPREQALGALHRAAGLLATGACLLAGPAVRAPASGHHAGMPLTGALLIAYLLLTIITLAQTYESRRGPRDESRTTPRPAVLGEIEIGVMAAGIAAMTLA